MGFELSALSGVARGSPWEGETILKGLAAGQSSHAAVRQNKPNALPLSNSSALRLVSLQRTCCSLRAVGRARTSPAGGAGPGQCSPAPTGRVAHLCHDH